MANANNRRPPRRGGIVNRTGFMDKHHWVAPLTQKAISHYDHQTKMSLSGNCCRARAGCSIDGARDQRCDPLELGAARSRSDHRIPTDARSPGIRDRAHVHVRRMGGSPEKLTGYLLNASHKRGGPKARLLLSVGYRTDDPQRLESDLRVQHLSIDGTRTSANAYGIVDEIEGPIKTPGGRTVRFCSVWQVDTGTDVPRFITMYPR